MATLSHVDNDMTIDEANAAIYAVFFLVGLILGGIIGLVIGIHIHKWA
jgi:hypothetical protein